MWISDDTVRLYQAAYTYIFIYSHISIYWNCSLKMVSNRGISHPLENKGNDLS